MVSFSFIPRDCNQAADTLAKEASHIFFRILVGWKKPLGVLAILFLGNIIVPRSPLLGSLLFFFP
jgi:ABC-type molybdate transport system permease subunit